MPVRTIPPTAPANSPSRAHPHHRATLTLLLLLLLTSCAALPAQEKQEKDEANWRLDRRPGTLSTEEDGPPPREIAFDEIDWQPAEDTELSEPAKLAFSIEPAKWRHSRTEHFIVHFRRVTEARKVARQIEYDLWYVSKALGYSRKDYAGLSHVFVFEDDQEWRRYLKKAGVSELVAAFAYGDDLFLNIRQGGTEAEGQVAHETAHAVVARLYPGQRWPLWLNEGLAEYMSSASVAARKGRYLGRLQSELEMAMMPLAELETLETYPEDPMQRWAYYETSESVVRYLRETHGLERFRQFIGAMLEGGELKKTIPQVYGEEYPDWAAFEESYQKSVRK